ncbi:HAD-IIIC family phosphatase [Pseudoalteromonas sp. OOF1S-7]|uniref:HAD-IIIC family phosphatase n=1 Tax=Pseudoalteromonas sp. OOF1S-7 TaxID=2917757 RepID=UPI001EF67BC4|nr:HAD-IIIC family phosphatase [Pseudoalteromonas sp. OOF1S-7]
MEKTKAPGQVKCVVWDLDNTLWDGILIEQDELQLSQSAVDTIKELDRRGILQSIASKNDHDLAMQKLEQYNLAEYFLYPQINWGTKSQSVSNIAQSLNIGIDTFAFIDDQPFEREEVLSCHPEVLCIDSLDIPQIIDMPAFMPRFITDESVKRRGMYLNDIERNKVEQSFEGPADEFLASLGMVFKIEQAKEVDLKRMEELVARTNQLNTTGRIYSYEELDAFRTCPQHELLVCSLQDKYGEYGKIGLALLALCPGGWTIKAFLMSCRVMSRGVGSIFLNYLINESIEQRQTLYAELIPNDRNRMMYTTYRFAGFSIYSEDAGVETLHYSSGARQGYPEFVNIEFPASGLFESVKAS